MAAVPPWAGVPTPVMATAAPASIPVRTLRVWFAESSVTVKRKPSPAASLMNSSSPSAAAVTFHSSVPWKGSVAAKNSFPPETVKNEMDEDEPDHGDVFEQIGIWIDYVRDMGYVATMSCENYLN